MNTIIEVRNVCKKYKIGKNKIDALDNINFDIKNGEVTVITGYSGSGKTTLLNAISSLIEIDSGKIIVNGDDITKYSESKRNDYRKSAISIIFQNYNLLNDLTIYENVLLGKKIGKSNIDIDKLFKLVNLQHRKNNYPNELSGGEQQRASIIRSISKGGNIFLCDEPTGALDVENGKIILDLLIKLAKEDNKTVIIITHNDIVKLLADHIIIMKDGKIVEDMYNDNPLDVDKVKW